MALLPRLVLKPAAVHAVTPAAVLLLHETVVTPLCRLRNASACAAGLTPTTNTMAAKMTSSVLFIVNSSMEKFA